MTAEKTKKSGSVETSTIVVILALIVILVGVTIAIPIVYSVGRVPAPSLAAILNISSDLTDNECTTLQTTSSSQTTQIDPLQYLSNQEPFPYKIFNSMYRPSVVSTNIYIIFGFRHDNKSWSLDKISVNDTTTGDDIIIDGDFESNYLKKSYYQCILSNTRSSVTDILFDIPYSGDFYYNDQTQVGMTYLMQQLPVTGGRYYNITFYLENRGYGTNTFLLLIGYLK